ncbi:hypothetical protein V5O48_003226 [Marasmius crinis-equi]|uniref:Uncharacterized protein n=1 Tax=Marasmius crinis-equi TaxID=585013 RepID=A0ABR3FTF9_9AGAR
MLVSKKETPNGRTDDVMGNGAFEHKTQHGGVTGVPPLSSCSNPEQYRYRGIEVLADAMATSQIDMYSNRPRKRLRSDSTRSPTPSRSHLKRRCHAASDARNLDGSNDAITEQTPVAPAPQAFHTSPSPMANSECPQPQVSEGAKNSSSAESDSSGEVYQSAEEGLTGSVAMEDDSELDSADKSDTNSSLNEDLPDAMHVEHGNPEAKRFSCRETEIGSFLSDMKDILRSFNGGEMGDEDNVITLRRKMNELEGLALEALIRARRLKNKLEAKRADAQLVLLTRWEVFCESKLGGV